MNIKFRLYNNDTESTEIFQFKNVKNLNDGYRQLFNDVVDNIHAYCSVVYNTCENLIDISEENFDEYDFIHNNGFNFSIDGQEYEFNIMGYEIF